MTSTEDIIALMLLGAPCGHIFIKGVKEVMALKNLWQKGKGVHSYTWNLFSNSVQFTFLKLRYNRHTTLCKFKIYDVI